MSEMRFSGRHKAAHCGKRFPGQHRIKDGIIAPVPENNAPSHIPVGIGYFFQEIFEFRYPEFIEQFGIIIDFTAPMGQEWSCALIRDYNM